MTTLLLTGATGSFGRAFVRRALDGKWFDRIIAFSDTESNQSRMKEDFPPQDNHLEYELGNVRDYARVREAMQGVDVVIHAAALKEVPTCAYDWPEAVATNVDGSRNVALAAIDAGVGRALLISTDKACDAVTDYGKTKAMAESWFVRANRGFTPFGYALINERESQGRRRRGHGTALAAVRYGNVLASRGSIVPAVKRVLEADEPVPLTDLRMTRFWWTLDQAVSFVDAVLAAMGPGQIWLPKLGAAPVLALVQALANNQSRLNVVGIRGKEKLHESMFAADEARHAWDLGWAYVVQPADATWPLTELPADATKVAEDFRYRSDNEDLWMTSQQLRDLIGVVA